MYLVVYYLLLNLDSTINEIVKFLEENKKIMHVSVLFFFNYGIIK